MSPRPYDAQRLRWVRTGLGAVAAAVVVLPGCSAPTADPPATDPRPRDTAAATPQPSSATATTRMPDLRPALPLRGRVVVLDPGHQLGNTSFPEQVGAPVDAGGLTKPCNTTGTATDDGYPEATFTWAVARLAQSELEAYGARVVLTRPSNSAESWGPCIDERGRAGNPGAPGPTADVKVSIHADGSYSAGARGFHVIAPPDRAPWTSDIAADSAGLAEVVRDALVNEGITPSTYAGTDGLDVRGDLGTLNLSDVPTVMVELGNMRDAGDAALMTSRSGRARYAYALSEAILRFLRS